jgi:hypothetical protein
MERAQVWRRRGHRVVMERRPRGTERRRGRGRVKSSALLAPCGMVAAQMAGEHAVECRTILSAISEARNRLDSGAFGAFDVLALHRAAMDPSLPLARLPSACRPSWLEERGGDPGRLRPRPLRPCLIGGNVPFGHRADPHPDRVRWPREQRQ